MNLHKKRRDDLVADIDAKLEQLRSGQTNLTPSLVDGYIALLNYHRNRLAGGPEQPESVDTLNDEG